MQIEKTQIEKTQIEDDEFDWPEEENAVEEAIRVAAAGIYKALIDAKSLHESAYIASQQASGLYASAFAMKNLAVTCSIRAGTINDVEQTFFDSPYFGWVTAMGENALMVRNAAVANMDNYVFSCRQYVQQCQTIAVRAVELVHIANLRFAEVFNNSTDSSRDDGSHYADVAGGLYAGVLNDLIEVMKVCNEIIQVSNNVSKLLDKMPELTDS